MLQTEENRPNGSKVQIWHIQSGEELHDIGNIDADVEIVQEFSRTRFAERHTEEIRYTHTNEMLRSLQEKLEAAEADPDDIPDEFERTARHRRLSLEEIDARLKRDGPRDLSEIPLLRERWFRTNQDILSGTPEKLPPFQGINHRIILMDDNRTHNYYLPRCPDALKPQLMNKIEKYTRAGWWEAKTVPQAAPMLCIPKKNGKLRTVIDCRK